MTHLNTTFKKKLEILNSFYLEFHSQSFPDVIYEILQISRILFVYKDLSKRLNHYQCVLWYNERHK